SIEHVAAWRDRDASVQRVISAGDRRTPVIPDPAGSTTNVMPSSKLDDRAGASVDKQRVNLVELHMVSIFRRVHGVPLQRMRRAISQLAREFPKDPHPLATRRFWTDGRDVLIRRMEGFVSLSARGQMALDDAIECYAQRDEWGNVPTRFYPWPLINLAAGMDRTDADLTRRSIVIDPGIAFGNATVAGTRVPTRA